MSGKKVIAVLGYCLLLMGILYLVYHQRNHYFELISYFNTQLLMTLVLIHIAVLAMGGLIFHLLSCTLGYRIQMQDWLGLSFSASLLNQLIPYRPGMAYRYLYLKKNYCYTLGDFFNVSLVSFLITIGMALSLGLLSCIVGELPAQLEGHLYPALFTFTGLLFLIAIVKKGFNGRSKKMVRHPLAYNRILQHPGLILLCLLTALTILTLGTLGMSQIFSTLQMPLPLWHCSFIISLLSLTLLFPVTPGNIGVAESVIGMMTQWLYGDFSFGFVVVALYRLGQLTVTLSIGAPLLGYFVMVRKIS